MSIDMCPAPDPREELIAHLAFLRASALSMVNDVARADDLVQMTFEKAWTNINRFQPGTNMRAWLFTILRNTYSSELRTLDREVSYAGGQIMINIGEKPSHDGRLALADFWRAFATLNHEQREALLIVGAHGFTYDEAAEICGVAPGTIKSRINRARRRLQSLLDFETGRGILPRDKMTKAVLNGQISIW
ncbi:sigma-70 family RNA polymerase sigma factor [Marivita sp. S0852]|uniref:sigma-70 family RNA polymerase sigma factor n=1 Tax=Marivita sp. S0852 TaxID=3373893 RepID=UPI0039822A79